MERQEIFDTVIKKLAKQGCVAHDGRKCQYYFEDDNGKELRCAIGHLLPKALAKQLANISNNDNNYDSSIAYFIKVKLDELRLPDWMNNNNSQFLTRLQSAHDQLADYNDNDSDHELDKEFFVSMKKIAKDYKLNSEILVKVAAKFGVSF